MLADISKFESLAKGTASPCVNDSVVFNSGAAVILERFDLMLRGKLRCDEWIKGLQEDQDLPADLAGQLFTSRENCAEELLRIKQQLMDEIQKSPLDAYDREVFASLSDAAKKELKPFIQADEVLSRAAEMEREKAQPAQQAPPAQPQEEEMPPEDQALGDEGIDFSEELQSEE